MRGFAHVLCVVGLAASGGLSACSAQEGVLLHIELKADATLPPIDRLQLYIGKQVSSESTFPDFVKGVATFEREVGTGDDVFLLSDYNVAAAFDLMVPAEQLPLWPEWRQVLIVGSVKNSTGGFTPVAWGASKVGVTARRVNRYDIPLRAVDNKFARVPGCVAWNAGLMIEPNARCLTLDTVCDGKDADEDGKPAVVDTGDCLSTVDSPTRTSSCNLIEHARCDELAAGRESYLCEADSQAAPICLANDHCSSVVSNGVYETIEDLRRPIKKLWMDPDVICKVPVEPDGVPCSMVRSFTVNLASSVVCERRLDGPRFVVPRYSTVGTWTVGVLPGNPSFPCQAIFSLENAGPQGPQPLVEGTVLIGVDVGMKKIGMVARLLPDSPPGNRCPTAPASVQCDNTRLPTVCLQ